MALIFRYQGFKILIHVSKSIVRSPVMSRHQHMVCGRTCSMWSFMSLSLILMALHHVKLMNTSFNTGQHFDVAWCHDKSTFCQIYWLVRFELVYDYVNRSNIMQNYSHLSNLPTFFPHLPKYTKAIKFQNSPKISHICKKWWQFSKFVNWGQYLTKCWKQRTVEKKVKYEQEYKKIKKK